MQNVRRIFVRTFANQSVLAVCIKFEENHSEKAWLRTMGIVEVNSIKFWNSRIRKLN